jgi:hypothetical protein
VLDAIRTPATLLESRVRMLLEAGLRPLVRNVDDRFTRRRALEAGAPMTSGRLLPRGATTPGDRSAQESALRALRMLASYADGRPADPTFDRYVHEDQHLGAALLRAIGSATLGVRGPRSVSHALNVLGRDAVMEELVSVTAKLLGDAASDPELGLIALRRARLLERLGSALDGTPHPRARAIAGLLSVAEFWTGGRRQCSWPSNWICLPRSRTFLGIAPCRLATSSTSLTRWSSRGGMTFARVAHDWELRRSSSGKPGSTRTAPRFANYVRGKHSMSAVQYLLGRFRTDADALRERAAALQNQKRRAAPMPPRRCGWPRPATKSLLWSVQFPMATTPQR